MPGAALQTAFWLSERVWLREFGLSLEHPQGVGIVGIVGTVGIVGIVGIEFYHPERRPTTPSVLVDIPCYSYLKEQKKVYTFSFPII